MVHLRAVQQQQFAHRHGIAVGREEGGGGVGVKFHVIAQSTAWPAVVVGRQAEVAVDRGVVVWLEQSE